MNILRLQQAYSEGIKPEKVDIGYGTSWPCETQALPMMAMNLRKSQNLQNDNT